MYHIFACKICSIRKFVTIPHLATQILAFLVLTGFLVCSSKAVAQDKTLQHIINGNFSPPSLTVYQFYHPKNEDLSDLYYLKAKVQDSLGDFDRSLVFIDSSIYFDPGFADAYLCKAITLMRQKKSMQALYYANIADSLGCDNLVYPVRGYLYVFGGDTAKARKDAERSLKYFPKEPYAYAIWGLIGLIAEDSSCLTYFDKAVSFSPDPQYVYYRLMASMEFGNIGRIKSDCRLFRTFSDKDSLMIFSVTAMEAAMYMIEQKEDSAFNTLKQYIVEYPANWMGYFLSGVFYREMGEAEKASEYLIKAWETTSKEPEISIALSEALAENGDLDQALQIINKAIEKNPLNASLYFTRGHIYVAQENDSLAGMDYKRARRIDPARYGSVYDEEYSSVERKHQAYAERIYELDSLIAENPIAEYYFLQGELLTEMKEYKRAAEAYTKIIDKEPGNAYAYHKRGNALWLSGKKKEGCNDLRKALQLGDKSAQGIINECCSAY